MAAAPPLARRGAAAQSLAVLGGLGTVGLLQPSFVSPSAKPPVRPARLAETGAQIGSPAAVGRAPSTAMNLPVALTALASGAAAAAGAVAAAARRRGQGRLPRAVAVARRAEGEPWMPRLSGWSDQELAAARQAALQLPEPDFGYAGPRYTGAACVTDQWITSLIGMQEKGAILPKKDAYLMVLDIIDLLGKESTIPDASIPQGSHLTVVGDLHGQYWDFMNVLNLAGRPSPQTPFVFNGDFVDRGSWSVEVITVLWAFKLKDPGSVHLNRGNHEMLETNILYGFCGECGAKYDMGLFDLFSEAFRRLPLAHLIENKVLCLHAGLPGPDPRIWMPGQTHDPTDSIPMGALPSLDQMRAVDRNTEITPETYPNTVGPTTDDKELNDTRIIIDMLWGDPRGGDGYGPSYRKGKGVYMFGPNITETFCTKNNLQCIIRSHEVKADGYRWDHKQLISVFSAPNYLDTGNNKGAFLRLTCAGAGAQVDIEPTNYTHVPHPDIPPMKWQENIMENYVHLTRKMKKKVQAQEFDEFGDSDFEGLMNFDEWEPDEAEAFQDAFKFDMYGRELPAEDS